MAKFLSNEIEILLDSIAEGVVVIDQESRILFINNVATELFLYSKEELNGSYLNELLPSKFRKHHNQNITNYFLNPRIRPMGLGLDLSGRRKDNTEFPIEISLCHLVSDEQPIGIAFITDITKRKGIALELEQRNKELDIYAQKITRDINSSLSRIGGYAKLLLFAPSLTLPEREEFLHEIYDSSIKLSQITKEMLLFTSLNKDEVKTDKIVILPLVQSALNRLESTIQECNASINIQEPLLNSMGYAPWIEEVWYQYLSNALKYGRKPPVIEIGSKKTQNKTILYWVKDNGYGLTPQEKEEILSANQDYMVYQKGAGLALVKQIVTKLNGQISIESEFGKGSIFSFSLPA